MEMVKEVVEKTTVKAPVHVVTEPVKSHEAVKAKTPVTDKTDNKYPLEVLLRPPVEYWSASTYAASGLLSILDPTVLWLNQPAGLGLGLSLLAMAFYRWKQGRRVVSYQKRLVQLPYFAMASKDIPQKPGHLFLGQGFAWQPLHTQRLYDTLQPEAQPFIKRQENAYGGNPILHGVGETDEPVWMNLNDRVGHTLVLGTTRVGKTRLLEVMVSQDIHNNDTVIVFDPKGDIELLRRIVFEAKRAGREDDLLIFHLGFPESSARYNPIADFARVTEVGNRISNQLPGSGESQAFREFAWRFVNIIACALVALGRVPDYQQIQRYIMNIDPLLKDYCEHWLSGIDPNWRSAIEEIKAELDSHDLPSHMRSRSKELIALVHYIQKNKFYNAVAEGLCSAFNYDKTYFDKITASLLPLLEKLTTGRSAQLICPNYVDQKDTRPIFDWMHVIRDKKIVYVGLDALSDSTVAGAVGNSMFSDLCSIAGQIYKFGVGTDAVDNADPKNFPRVCIHADEFNELIGDDFIPLLNKAGGANFQVTAYTQTWADVQAGLQDNAKAMQVGGNLNTIICLRVLDEITAEWLTSKLTQKVSVKTLVPGTSVSDNKEGFSVNNDDRINTVEIPLLTPNDLIQLPKGQAFLLKNGGTLYKLRIPLPKDDMSHIPNTIDQMVEMIRSRPKSQQNTSETPVTVVTETQHASVAATAEVTAKPENVPDNTVQTEEQRHG